MESSKSKILILEDDEAIGAALKEVLVRAGFQAFWAVRPDEANSVLSNHKIDYLFCDCLLPQMTGLDFIKQAQTNYLSSKFKVILMSGIYTDKAFIQEATRNTGAIAFLKKPFENEQVLKLVKKEEAASGNVKEDLGPRKMLYQFFASSSVTARQKKKVIESIEEVSGFDLPFLYSLLVETKSNGYLNIYNGDGSVSGVAFCNGNIVGIDVDDKTTFFGEMLIQNGYATPKNVQEALRDKQNRRLGNYLIQNNQLSPHAFDLILLEQMNIRLVRTIVDQKVRVNFAQAEVEMTSPCIDAETLSYYLHDWIASKISLNWLKSLFVMWSGHLILKSPSYREDHPALNMSLIKTLEGLTMRLANQVTLTQLLEVKGYSEVAVYKAIHFLLTKGLITFAHRTSFASPHEQMKVLRKIWSEIENKNDYEIVSRMGITESLDENTQALEEFISLLGEMPSETDVEGYDLWNKIRNKAEQAILSSRDATKVSMLRQASQKTEAEGKMRAASLMEEVKKHLHLNQYGKALENLAAIPALDSQLQQFHIYNSWAKLGAMDPAKKIFVLKEVELELLQVPPDERYDTLFPFVIGLFNKAKGDINSAKKSFEKSVALDGSFIPARRELSLLIAQNKKQDIFEMDLKQVVSGFFKKR